MGWGDKGGWQGEGGGPWGKPGGARPGGSGGGDRPGSGRPPGRKPENDTEWDRMVRSARTQLDRVLGSGGGYGGEPDTRRLLVLGGLGLAFFWLASGIYIVEPNEQGVVTRFGAFHRTAEPGPNYHLPFPVERVNVLDVTSINRTEIGRRSGPRPGIEAAVSEESLMLTSDENIVDVNFEVQWVIRNAASYLLNVQDPKQAVKTAAESAMREIIGHTQLSPLIATEGGETIRPQIESQVTKLLQSILDSYGAGIQITKVNLGKADTPEQVIEAYRDVQRAQTDQERARNQAEAYRNDILPRARGQAAKMVQEAEAYREQVIAASEGDASRFKAIVSEYRGAKDVTRQRLYLETMEQVLKGMTKVVVDQKSTPGVLPYMALPALKPAAGTSSETAAPAQEKEARQ